MSDTELATRTVHDVLQEKVARDGNRTFLFFEDREFGYADIDIASDRVAAACQRLGLGKGDKAAIMLANRPEYLFIWFGLSKIGALEVPLNTAHKGELLSYMIDRADCRVIFIEKEFVPALNEVLDGLGKLDHVIVLDAAGARDGGALGVAYDAFRDGAQHPEKVVVTGMDPAVIVFTSGTTGPSKGSVLPHNYPLFMGDVVCDMGRYSPDDRLLNALPLFHGNAQFLSTVPALQSGAQMVLERRFSATTFWDTVRRFECTEFNYIGGILSILLKADPAPGDVDNPLRVMVGAGAPPNRFDEFEQRFDVRLIEGYGMSEIGIPLSNTMEDRKPGSCGKPHAGYELMVIDDDGREAGPDIPGELLIRPGGRYRMMLEYYGMPEKTVEAWRDLWFHTGDYLSYDKAGYFYFADRKKDALRRRGENISSFEVERTVLSHEAILECAAVAVPSELGEDEVMICLTLKDGHSLDPAAFVAFCEERMAGFMVPRYVRVLDALPKTPTERIQKYLLRQQGVTDDTYDREA
ncbi:MAG: AMP-binding protein [Gammaproteobacteria bacterium]|nr:AMP-binding protein [Gammaproteobacteria bacterium]